MSNPLTGDFEAVLSVSGVTVNRLLASMHQNDGSKSNLPTMPHVAILLIGEDRPIDGLKGKIWVQIASPRIELIHGSTDRFWLEVGIRARYKPDSGTQPLPEFIHGVVRAQYRLEGIDPTCRGWSKKASEYIWVRVVGDSVSFTGTALDDLDPMILVTPGESQAVVNGRITRLITVLLKTKFEATPHHVSKRFRRGGMRSLHLGIDQSAVVVPIGLPGDPVQGQIDSIDQDLLEGRDFGIAISREYILSQVQPILDDVKANYHQNISYYSKTTLDVGLFDVDVLTIDIKWSVTLTGATASWSGGWIPILNISAGIITISVTGQALTQNSAFNITFSATQIVVVTFDPSSEKFVVNVSGSPTVQVQPQAYEKYAKSRIEQQIKPQVEGAVNQIVSQLDLSARKTELIEQLKTLDDQADARFDEGVFGPDGVIVRGRIFLSPRRRPVSAFDKTVELDGFTALESWIPGGGISKFEWSWRPFDGSGESGGLTEDDRFILRRPAAAGGVGKFGIALGLKTALPGLDTTGRICLKVTGMQTDPNTGAMVPAQSGQKCERSGFDIHAVGYVGAGRVFIREWLPKHGDPSGPVQEVGIVQVGGKRSQNTVSNTLVLYVGERWNPDTAAILRDGLRSCRRDDAGLLVMILFKDGFLTAGGQELRAELDHLSASIEAHIVVNEDVQGSWSSALAFRSGTGERSWRLIGPGGGVTWMHDGRIAAEALGAALDGYLLPSPPPQARRVLPRVEVGSPIAATALHPGYIDLMVEAESRCPPLPLGRFGRLGSVVTFVNMKAASSHAQLREIADRYSGSGENSPVIVAVVDGVDADQADAFGNDLGLDIATIPDPVGMIARRFGVRVWPTTVTLNRLGTVSNVEIGQSARGPERPDRPDRPEDQDRPDRPDREPDGNQPSKRGNKA
jgi:hypothetical protein